MASSWNPTAKRSIAVCYDVSGALLAAGVLPLALSGGFKRIRRLPHLFSRVLELPVHAETHVNVLESGSCFTFSVSLPYPRFVLPEEVRAEIVEIAPGVTKLHIAGAHRATAVLDEYDIPLWRFRLPDSSVPESSSAACDIHGLLTLTVPKLPSSAPYLLESYQVRPFSDSDPPDEIIDSGMAVVEPSSSSMLDAVVEPLSSSILDVQNDSMDDLHASSLVMTDASHAADGEVSDCQNLHGGDIRSATTQTSLQKSGKDAH